MSRDCEDIGPVEVEITTEPPEGPPCCMEVFWLRWVCQHGIITRDGSLRLIDEGMV